MKALRMIMVSFAVRSHLDRVRVGASRSCAAGSCGGTRFPEAFMGTVNR